MSSYILLGLAAILVSLFIGGLFGRLWKRHEKRTTEKRWQERERLLNRQKGVASRHEVLRRRALRRRLDAPGRGSARRPRRGRYPGR